MKNCPNCQNPIQGSFGMVMCGSCGAAVFFDLDGNPQMPTALDESSDAVVDQEPQFESHNTQNNINEFDSGTNHPSENSNHTESLIESSPIADSITEPITESIEYAESTEPVVSTVSNEPEYGAVSEPVYNLDQPLADQLVQEEKITNTEELIGEVLEFANKPTNEIVGNLSYTLVIQGIDTLELRKELLEELRDKRFGWSISEIESAIESGTLTLTELNPIQTAIIVKRLRPLPLSVQWKQNL